MPTTTTRRTALASLALGALLLFALAALGAAGSWQRADAQDDRRAAAVTVGRSHACALLDSGAVECWGRNSEGQTNAPAGNFSAVSAGGWHTCGLRETGAVECWGWNEYGQADVPAWLRESMLGVPATGSGGLLDRSTGIHRACLAAFGAALLSLLALALLRRNRRRS